MYTFSSIGDHFLSPETLKCSNPAPKRYTLNREGRVLRGRFEGESLPHAAQLFDLLRGLRVERLGFRDL